MLVTSIFSFFPQCFLRCQGHKSSFKLLLNWRLRMLSIWTSSLKFCRLVKCETLYQTVKFCYCPNSKLDCFYAVFNINLVISWRPVHLSMRSWIFFFFFFFAQYSIKATGCFPTEPLSKQWQR